MKGMQKIIVGIAILIIVVLGIVNFVDLKTAVFSIQKSIEEERKEDTIDAAGILGEREMEKMQKQIEDYEKRLREEKIDVVLQRNKVNALQNAYAEGRELKEDFAAEVRKSLAAGKENFVLYGKYYTPETARKQLTAYVVEEESISAEIRHAEEKLAEQEQAVNSFEQSIRDMHNEYAALDSRLITLLAEKEVSEVKKISSDINSILSGTADDSVLSRTTENIYTIISGLEERIIADSAGIQFSGSSVYSDSNTGTDGMMTFEETERAKKAAEREDAIQAEVQALLGVSDETDIEEQ